MWSTGKRLDDKDVTMAILAYIIRKQEEENKRPTANEIMKKAPEFIQQSQRMPRINKLLKNLEKTGFVRSENFDMGTVWGITAEGREYYRKLSDLLRQVFYL